MSPKKKSPVKKSLPKPRTIADVNRDQAKEMEKALGPIKEKTNGLASKLKSTPVDTAPHIVVEAYAGTGKTFTQIVGVAWAFGNAIWPEIQRGIAEAINRKAGRQKIDPATFKITPSDEQQLVWDSFALSRGFVKTITYCAFNKSIVTEFGMEWGWLVKLLQERCGVTLQFATVNALGNRACTAAYGRLNVTDKHSENLMLKLLSSRDIWELRKKEPTLVAAVPELVNLCKLSLTGWDEQLGFLADSITDDDLDRLTSFYDIELNGSRTKVYDLVRSVLEHSIDPKDSNEMDFNDQNWLPVIHRLPVAKSDLILIDEGQDLNRCKQEFCRMLGRRIVLVGDVNQAIYGFAGADTESIPRMRQLLSPTDEPLVSLRLTETRRCGKAIVREAQKYVKDFRAHDSNPEGLVRRQGMIKYQTEIQDGDMALCRVNAPLVSQALKLIAAGRKAIIRGRDFGVSLINFVRKMKADTVGDLLVAVDDWAVNEQMKESKKKNPSEAKIIAIGDKKSCIHAFCDNVLTIQEVLDKMDLVFAGRQCPKCQKHFKEEVESCFNCQVPLVQPKGVVFSSVHKAKGLESNRVFILQPKEGRMPHPMAKSEWQHEQELHIIYIAITRAIEELVYVTDGDA